MSATDELKPCPFCGGEATLKDARNCLVVSRFSYIFPFSVGCENKHCEVKPYTLYCDTEAEAIAAWNRRADT